jgi:hypothetical protein
MMLRQTPELGRAQPSFAYELFQFHNANQKVQQFSLNILTFYGEISLKAVSIVHAMQGPNDKGSTTMPSTTLSSN